MLKHWGLLATLLVGSAAGASSYHDDVQKGATEEAALAEMVSLYDQVCLRAFPDDAAVAKIMADRGARVLGRAELAIYLHDDPGVGWKIRGQTGDFTLTVEHPPYHACGLRRMTPAGFKDVAAYRTLADSYEKGQGGGFAPTKPMNLDIGGVRTVLAGEARMRSDGGADSLMFVVGTPADPLMREKGDTGIEVRFVHQLYEPARPVS